MIEVCVHFEIHGSSKMSQVTERKKSTRSQFRKKSHLLMMPSRSISLMQRSDEQFNTNHLASHLTMVPRLDMNFKRLSHFQVNHVYGSTSMQHHRHTNYFEGSLNLVDMSQLKTAASNFVLTSSVTSINSLAYILFIV